MESRDQLSLLPDDVKLVLRRNYLQRNGLFTLAKTSKYWRDFYITSDALVPREGRAEFLDILRKLLSLSALGAWNAAYPIWMPLPSLLSCRGMVYHPNPKEITFYMNMGRYKFELTPWQIAWVNEEYDIVEEQAKYMDADDKQAQCDEIFPDGKLIKYNWNLEEFIKLLEALFEAVKQDELINYNNLDEMEASTREKLYSVYHCLDPAKYAQKGLVSDPAAYEATLDIYDKKWQQLKNAQHAFWNIRVEEAVASTLGTGYLRPHSQGLDNKTENTGCVLADKSSYFPFRRLDSIPGFHFRVNIYGQRTVVVLHDASLSPARNLDAAASFKSYVEQNQSKGQNLCESIRSQKLRNA